MPETLEMLDRLESLMGDEGWPSAVGARCADIVGFLFLLRVSEHEQLCWNEASIIRDDEGDMSARLEIPRSKTDQYNQGHVEILKVADRPLYTARDFSRWLRLDHRLDQGDVPPFLCNVRKTLSTALKLDAAYRNVDHSRISNHSLRSGRAALMFSVGLDVEVVKRRGMFLPPTFHTYMARWTHFRTHRPGNDEQHYVVTPRRRKTGDIPDDTGRIYTAEKADRNIKGDAGRPETSPTSAHGSRRLGDYQSCM